MKTYSASFFKTNFGAVLDRAGIEPVRIERRGRQATVLLPEADYEVMKNQSLGTGRKPEEALSRLEELARGPEVKIGHSRMNPRTAAIFKKHLRRS